MEPGSWDTRAGRILEASFGAEVGLPAQAMHLQDVFPVGPMALVFAALLYISNMGLSMWLSLGLQRTMLVSLLRCGSRL